MNLETALSLILTFRRMGASKLSILGGEPSLYGASENNGPLLVLINEAKRIGYEYIRLDTNGATSCIGSLLFKKDFGKLDEISFSLDGATPQINDPIRGQGVFDECVSNIRAAVNLGYNVDVTCCVHRRLLERNGNGTLLLESMIDLATYLRVRRINFHVLFDRGTPEDAWTTHELHVAPEDWVTAYAELKRNINAGKYRIPVRIPQSFVSREEFEKNPRYYGYCPVKLGERVLVHPNGIIRICSSLLCTPYCVGFYYNGKIAWNRTSTNELRDHKLNAPTPCTNQSKKYSGGKFVPLCFSFKPGQDEIIWQRKIGWESSTGL